MDNIKNDQKYLEEMINDLNTIIHYMDGVDEDMFVNNAQLIDSVSFRFVLLNSSFKNLSNDFLLKHPQIPGHLISSFRNRLIHEYGKVDYHIVFVTAKYDAVDLLTKLIEAKK